MSRQAGTAALDNPWGQRVGQGDWAAITAEVNEHGGALLWHLLSDAETAEFRARYEPDELFRRDLYGELVFPLQVVINLSHPGIDHTGGEFLLLEPRPRPVPRHRHPPAARTRLRLHHPRPPRRLSTRLVSRPRPPRRLVIRTGQRYTLALVLHDAA